MVYCTNSVPFYHSCDLTYSLSIHKLQITHLIQLWPKMHMKPDVHNSVSRFHLPSVIQLPRPLLVSSMVLI